MEPLDFLRAVWPSNGSWYCIGVPYDLSKSGALKHHMFETIEEAADFVDRVKGKHTCYFACHTLAKEQVWNERKKFNKEEKVWEAGWSVRVQSNAELGKIFFFDIDVGGEKAYVNQDAAVLALREFCKTAKLPRPMIVSSGGGLHVYWTLTRPLTSNYEWFTIASRLRQLAQRHELKIDTTRTTDTASVLRVAGSFNWKKGQQRPVLVYQTTNEVDPDEFNTKIVNALDAAGVAPITGKTASPDTGLGSNMEKEFDGNAIELEDLLSTCAQMKRQWEMKGKTTEPEWYATLQILRTCRDGRALAHEYSSGDPRYTEYETDTKLDQVSGMGATSCETFRQKGTDPDLCKGCPFYQNSLASPKFNPFKATYMTAVAPAPVVEDVDEDTGEIIKVEIPQPPKPYQRIKGEGGGIGILVENDEGVTELRKIFDYDLYPVERYADRTEGTEVQKWMYHPPHEKPFAFSLNAADFADNKAFIRVVAGHGIYPVANNFTPLRLYMSAYIKQLQADKAPKKQYSAFGWAEEHTAFVIGDKIYHPGGVEKTVKLGDVAHSFAGMIAQRGTLQAQVDALDFFNRPIFLRQQFAIGAALGSTLMHMTGHGGLLINMTGETGAYKSVSLFAGGSFWGPPSKFVLNAMADGATKLSREKRRSVLSNLPNCMDEITDVDVEDLKSMALGITQKTGRIGLTQGGLKKKGIESELSNLTICSANISLQSVLQHKNMAGAAGAVRVFEILCDKIPLEVISADEIGAFMRKIEKNHGHIGPVFARYVVDNYAKVEARVLAVQDLLIRQYKMQPEERFWFAGIACTIVALQIAHKLGLLRFNVASILHWVMMEQLGRQRGIVTEETGMNDPVAILSEFLQSHVGTILIMQKGVQPFTTTKVMREVLGQLDLNNNELWLQLAALRTYCSRRNVDYRKIRETLAKLGICQLVDKKKVIGHGTDFAMARTNVLVIDMNHPDLKDLELVPVGPPSHMPPDLQNTAR